MTTSTRRNKVLADLLVAAAMGVAIAGLCVALAWIVPLELVPPRPS